MKALLFIALLLVAEEPKNDGALKHRAEAHEKRALEHHPDGGTR